MILLAFAAATMAQPAAAPAHPAHHTATPAPAAASAARFSVATTTIGDILANPAATAAVEKHIPGFSSHPALAQVRQMTLKAVQPMAPAHLTDALLAAIEKELAALPAS